MHATRLAEGNSGGREWRQEGVEGHEGDLEVADGEWKFAAMDDDDLEVDGLEPCDVRVLLVSFDGDEFVELGSERGKSVLGVAVWREVGVEGPAADGERVMGEDGLVLRMEEDLLGLRVTEPVLAGFE